MNKRRLLGFLTAFCLCAATCTAPMLAYADVDEQDACYAAVEAADRYGLMNGVGEDQFAPEAEVDRAMFVTILGRMLGAPVSQYARQTDFTDVAPASWYGPYVAWASECGIASGVGGGLFEPGRTVTRQEAAVFMFRAYTEAGLGPQGAWSARLDYTDLAEVEQWAYEGVAYCTLQGIMGDIDGRFEPDKAVTRGDAAMMATVMFADVMDSLYAGAVADAVDAQPDEIYPLVTLSPDSSMTTWDDKGRVLLLTWHRDPESYPQGEEITLQNGEVWTFTDKEIRAWYQDAGEDAASIGPRLEQLIGLPLDSGYTHVSAFWVKPQDIVRPAYCIDATVDAMSNYFSGGIDRDYLEWFNENIQWSYTESAYPWTRLGYTYDWSLYGGEYGLTEFLVKPDSEVAVEFTKTTAEFVEWLAEPNMEG